MAGETQGGRGLPRAVVMLGVARMSEALGNGFVVLAIPTTVAVLPHEYFPFAESTRVGLIVSLFGFLLGLTQPVVGRMAASGETLRRFVLGGVFAFTLVTAAMTVATTYWQLLAFRALQGLCMACVVPPTLALIALHARPGQRGAAMGFFGMARMTGFGLGPIVGGLVLLAVANHEAYLVAAIPGALAALMIAFGVPAHPPAQEPHHAVAAGAIAEGEVRAERREPGLGAFLPLSAAMFACACSVAAMSVLENQFIDRLGQTTFEFGFAFSALVIVRIFIDWPVGRASDRLGRKTFMVPGLMALGPLTLLMAYAETTAWLVVVRVGMGVAMAGVSAPVYALAADLAPDARTASRISWVTAGFAMGLAVGPLITGIMADAWGFESPFWLFGCVCVVVAVVVQVFAPEGVQSSRSG